jgi:hypothetical protein
MATAKQIAANRRNAQKSTGPRTQAGLEKVSQNRLVHGLCAQFNILNGIESQNQFDTLVAKLIEDEKPVGQNETELVIQMAEHLWMAKRALRMESSCFVPQPATPEQNASRETSIGIANDLERFVRYHGAHDRAYHRAFASLLKSRKERRLAEIGFESQKRAQAEEIRKDAKESRQAEKHIVHMAIATVRKQREEMKLGQEFAAIMPGFDVSSLNSNFSAALAKIAPPGC